MIRGIGNDALDIAVGRSYVLDVQGSEVRKAAASLGKDGCGRAVGEKRDYLVKIIQWDAEWFDTWVKGHPPPPGITLTPRLE